MADYYWYNKYSVSFDYKLEPGANEQVVDSKYLIPGNQATTNYGDYGGGQILQQFYEDYDIEPYATYGDYTSYEFVLKNPISWSDAWNSNTRVYVQDGLYNIDGNHIVLALKSGFATYAYNFNKYWAITGEHKIVPDLEGGLSGSEYVDRVYRVGIKGNLLEEDLIKPNSYPVNGIKDGYWWVRKEPYTYPPPILISPINGYIIRLDEGADIPYFVFEIQERFVGSDSNLYHVRIRLGNNSDFKGNNLTLESRNNPSIFEYSTNEGDLWQAFPSEGVPALSWVRVRPDAEFFDFGFYYWDATVYGSQWGFGKPAQPRILVVITDSDDVYFLTINGKRYYAKNITIKESSNGEISNLNFTLLNNNI